MQCSCNQEQINTLHPNGVGFSWSLIFFFVISSQMYAVLLLVSCEGRIEKLNLNCLPNSISVVLELCVDSGVIWYSWIKEYHDLSD